ncbi:MAG: hypothetical protein RL662_1585 [Bacteroidota bacterium]|jgi:LysM repeat protein/soluble lytic murein transglycosylase-like protein
MFKQLLIASFIFSSTIFLSAQQSRKQSVSLKDTITDRDIVVPEEMERNFDQLLIDWKKDLKPALDCNSSSNSNLTYPESVYIDRLYNLPTMMELVYNPIVRSYIDMYTGRRSNSIGYFLGKSQYYFPIFEQALDKYGLPLELKYLPIIESALNPTIVSRAGATGLWQFMIGTARMYNLEVNSLVDERRDPVRSSDAAARFLKDLYDIYGDWNLVIAAYNCGPGNVNKAIKRSGGQTDYWTIYPYLPRETRGYVPAFIAATYAMNYYTEHNICPSEYKYRHSTDTISVDRHIHLQQLAEVLNLPIDEIRNLNPQFKNEIVPGDFKRYVLTLPSKYAADFEVQKDAVYAYRTDDLLVHRKVVDVVESDSRTTTKRVRHKVRRGESLASIASNYGVKTSQIKKWNRLKSNKVSTGQLLVINQPVATPKRTAPKSENSGYYSQNKTTIQPSQTQSDSENNSEYQADASTELSEYFAKKSNGKPSISVDAETVLDNDTSTAREARTPNEPQTIYHKVRIGETISQIAAKYNVDKNDISKWNKVKSNLPKVGTRLVIHLPEKVIQPEAVDLDDADETKDIFASESLPIDSSSFAAYKASEAIVTIPQANIVSINTSNTQRKVITIDDREERKQTPAKKAKKEIPAKPKKASVYTVKKGDTMSSIAQKSKGNLTASDIMKANSLKSSKLKIGQKLNIPPK